MKIYEESENESRSKRIYNNRYESIDRAIFDWFLAQRQRNFPISGELIREKVQSLAMSQGITEFKSSYGWLARFKERHSITLKTIAGQAGFVDSEVVNNWHEKLKLITIGYSPSDIYNIDET